MTDPVRIISNSEVSTFLKCERRHYYAHGLKLAPKVYGRSLSRGIIGHEALEKYYGVLIKNGGFEDARIEAYSVLTPAIVDGNDAQMVGELATLLGEYFDHYEKQDNWNIIAVEKEMSIPLGDGAFDYGMKFDLLVEMRKGPFAGEIVLVDHKFVYNFWNADNLMMNMQGPKYIATLNYHKIPVKRIMINQLRWRIVKSNPEKFRREYITPTGVEVKRLMAEQYQASERIMERSSDLDTYKETALRTIDTMTCQNCSYTLLCKTELQGQDTSLLIQTEFKDNTYGYSHAAVEDDLYA